MSVLAPETALDSFLDVAAGGCSSCVWWIPLNSGHTQSSVAGGIGKLAEKAELAVGFRRGRGAAVVSPRAVAAPLPSRRANTQSPQSKALVRCTGPRGIIVLQCILQHCCKHTLRMVVIKNQQMVKTIR